MTGDGRGWDRGARPPAMFAVACLAVWGLALSASGAEESKPADSIQIPAWAFDRGNAKVGPNADLYADYRDKYPRDNLVTGDGGRRPWVVEYDVDFSVDAPYTLHVRYASPESRPLEVWLDDRRAVTGCGSVTGQSSPNPWRGGNVGTGLGYPSQSLSPQPGDSGPRMVHYPRDVQPILNERCTGCHGGEEPEGGLVLSGQLTEMWNSSYENLIDQALVSYLDGGGGCANVPTEPPMTFGSHQSKLVERIRRDPCKGDLTREEFIRIVTWIDANAPYYGTHRGKKHLKWREEPDFRPLPMAGK